MRALKKMGYKIDSLANMASYGGEGFDTLAIYKDERQFKNYIQDNIGKWDLIDFSNEPDYPVRWIKEVDPSIPVLADLHDLDSVRRGFIPVEERIMFNKADAFIYVSNPIQTITNELHNLTKPNTVLYSYCNDDLVSWNEEDIPARKSIVYEGGANPPDNKALNEAFKYRYLYDIAKRLVEMGNETHMYFGNLDGYQSHQTIGAVCHPPTQYDKMMKELIQYKYGILIFNNENGTENQVNFTTTNKESEYLHAGLPSLACWCPESIKHVKKHGTGFTFESVEEIGDCSSFESKYLDIMENVKQKKKELVMENYIVRVENLYAEILGVEKKFIPEHIEKLHRLDFDEK